MTIYDLSILLFLVSSICLIIGLINPSIFNRIFKKQLNRKNTSSIFGIALIASFILAGMTMPPSSKELATQTNNQNIEQNTTQENEIIPSNIESDKKSGNSPVDETKASSQEATSPTQTQKIQEPTPIIISGAGQQATQKFNLEQGLAIFTMQNSGQGNFIVHLLDSEGNTLPSFVNEIGNYNGSRAVQISKQGTYIFDINSDGLWTITITQPKPTTAQLVSSLNGSGDKATSFLNLSQGLHTFSFTHNGNKNFIVHLLDRNGNSTESLVNEIGNYSGSRAIRINSSGIYLFDIIADGNWTVSIQ
jgi:hypothetical protein